MKNINQIYQLIQYKLVENHLEGKYISICDAINILHNTDIINDSEFFFLLRDLGVRNPSKNYKYNLFKYNKDVPGGNWYPLNQNGYQYRLLLLNRIIKDTVPPKLTWFQRIFS